MPQGIWKNKQLRHEASALTGLPASPDNAAVLLLRARNEWVGVRSLLTMLLSHGLSCRRRAERAPYKQDVRSNASRITTLQKCYLLTTAYHENTATVFQRSKAYNHSVFCISFSLRFSRGIPIGTRIWTFNCVTACGTMVNHYQINTDNVQICHIPHRNDRITSVLGERLSLLNIDFDGDVCVPNSYKICFLLVTKEPNH